MIKYICDLCNKEIVDRNESGTFKTSNYEWNLLKKNAEKLIRMTEQIFCKECCGKIVNNFKNICQKGEEKKQ